MSRSHSHVAAALEVAVSLGMAALTMAMHLTGLEGLTRLTRYHLDHLRSPWLAFDRLAIPLLITLGLFALHALEIGAFAILFHQVHQTLDWEQAVYFSASAYSTADVTSLDLAPHWRVTGSLESLNGVLLVGWSTAYLFTSLSRILHAEENDLLPLGAIARRRKAAERPNRRTGRPGPHCRRGRADRAAEPRLRQIPARLS